MKIQHNLTALNAHRQMGINNNKTAKNLEKLSSGYRINRAGDDAAGLAISEKMRAQIKGLEMAKTNGENGISLVQTAAGALNETTAMLQRIRELAVQASNGIYDDATDRAVTDVEVTDLLAEIDRVAAVTSFNNITLLDGTKAAAGSGISLEIGAMGTANDRIEVCIADMTSTGLGVNAVTVATDADAQAAIATIDTAINTVSTTRASLGAAQNRLEHTVKNLGVNNENLTAAESRIRDVDMAEEMMNFTKNNVLLQAAQSMLAQANMQPQGILQLLR